MKRLFALLLVISLALSMLATGCTNSRQSKIPDEKEIAARVDDEYITKKQLEKILKLRAQANPALGKAIMNEQEKNKRLKIIREEWINDRLLDKLAEKEKIELNPDFIERQVEDIRRNFISRMKKMLIQQKIRKNISVSGSEIKKYYSNNKNRFISSTEYRFSHILVKSKKDVSKVLKALEAGKKFNDLAAKYSQDDSTKNKGGDTGWIKKLDLKPFYIKAFPFREGKITVVKTKSGYEIIKSVGIRQNIKPLNNVAGQIGEILLDKKINDQTEQMLKAIQEKTEVKRSDL